MAMRSMDPSLALPDLLRANLRVTLTWSKAKAAVAALVSALYALEYYSLNELVEEVAALCNRYPQDSDVFAVSTLCPPEVTRAALWHCTAAINFSRQTFDKVMAVSPQSRAEYLDLTPEAFEPPVTDEEMRLVVTLLKEWEGRWCHSLKPCDCSKPRRQHRQRMTANPVSNADDDFIAGSQNRLRTVAELRAATDYLVTNATVNDYESIRLRWDADTSS